MLLAMSSRTPLARNEAVAVVGRPVLATTSASSFAWRTAAAACSSGINSLPHALPSAKYVPGACLVQVAGSRRSRSARESRLQMPTTGVAAVGLVGGRDAPTPSPARTASYLARLARSVLIDQS